MKHILVVTSDSESVEPIRSTFPKSTIQKTVTCQQALDLLSRRRFDLVFIDINEISGVSGSGGYEAAIRDFKRLYPTLEIVTITPQDKIHEAVKAVKAGASDYISHPIKPEEIKLVSDWIQQNAIMHTELNYLRDQFWKTDVEELVQTKNPLMKRVFENIQSVAATRTTVLLYGETGTGKGVLANLIHLHSNREDGMFVSVHCGAVPDSLLESELFGHEKGAFTGAIKRKLGKFEIAEHGSIFLDEIGTITPSAQIKLLQVLQNGTFYRIGGEDLLKTNARTITATNSDLKSMCHAGTFRKDLYYRLNVFPITIPPLRERKEDIPLLVNTFLKRLGREMGKDIRSVHPEVLKAMSAYPWPGNIRELENIMERAFILETAPMLTPDSFPPELMGKAAQKSVPIDCAEPIAEARKHAINDFEKRYLSKIISKNYGKMKQAAVEAGISTRQLRKLMGKHGIRKEDYKPKNR